MPKSAADDPKHAFNSKQHEDERQRRDTRWHQIKLMISMEKWSGR